MPFRRVLMFIPGPGEVDPGWGIDEGGGPVYPGHGLPISPGHPGNALPWFPGRPGNDLPWAPGRPGNDLPWAPGHPGNALPGGGYPSGGPIKPPGIPILPVDPDWDKPEGGHPWLPGSWVPIDPGFGKPPIWGFVPVDPGWGGGTVAPPRPDAGLPETPGHWVPIDPDYGKPVRPCPPVGGKPHPPIWAWIPEIGPDFGLKPAQPK